MSQSSEEQKRVKESEEVHEHIFKQIKFLIEKGRLIMIKGENSYSGLLGDFYVCIAILSNVLAAFSIENLEAGKEKSDALVALATMKIHVNEKDNRLKIEGMSNLFINSKYRDDLQKLINAFGVTEEIMNG